MRKPPETTFSTGSLHPMLQSYPKLSEMRKDIQDPQKIMPQATLEMRNPRKEMKTTSE
jgi:hypothetical protein